MESIGAPRRRRRIRKGDVDSVVLAWYGWLSGLTQGTVLTLQTWADHLHLPLVTVVLLGVVGATSPCQLTTNLSALAYASAQPGRGRPFLLGVAYVAGKVSVYSLVGALVILAGLRLEAVSIPIVQVARKALGPLMVIIGLGMLGWLRLRTGMGRRLAARMRERLAPRGLGGAFLLGVAFSFAFCPTLFWLFFGLTLPLALRSSGGWMFPGLFAVGSSLPLLVVTGVVAAGIGAVGTIVRRVVRLDRPLRLVAGVVFIIAGLHDTLVYWLL